MPFTVATEERKTFPHEVRWNGGKSYCRCASIKEAEAIALALNMLAKMKEGDGRLTSQEIAALGYALRDGRATPPAWFDATP